jgi:hypothetical protein
MTPGFSAARVTVASIVLSPSSARKNTPPTARTADLVAVAAFRSSSSLSSSPRRVQAAKQKNASPARIEIGPVGSTAPSAAPSSTLSRWTIAVATVMPMSTVGARNRVAKVRAMSWLLSPSSATKIKIRLRRNADTPAHPGHMKLEDMKLEVDADEDRLVDELHAEGGADAVPYLPGQVEEVGGAGAAGIGEGEGVLGRDADRPPGVALREAGLLDQPGG